MSCVMPVVNFHCGRPCPDHNVVQCQMFTRSFLAALWRRSASAGWSDRVRAAVSRSDRGAGHGAGIAYHADGLMRRATPRAPGCRPFAQFADVQSPARSMAAAFRPAMWRMSTPAPQLSVEMRWQSDRPIIDARSPNGRPSQMCSHQNKPALSTRSPPVHFGQRPRGLISPISPCRSSWAKTL